MMSLLQNASIKKRLIAVILFATTVSVLLTTAAISVIGVYNLRLSMISELSLSASIVGDRNTAALLFNDDTAAASNMKVFGLKRGVMRACLYDKQGNIFASYVSDEVKNPASCPADQADRVVESAKSIELVQGIYKMEERIGAIYIESDLKDIAAYIQKQTYIALTVMAAVLLVSYLLAIYLQHGLTAPILNLAATAREISLNKDYSLRAKTVGDASGGENEIAVLTESFNSMLQEIGTRDQQLKQQNVEIAKSRDLAEAANRAKSQFLANISHELRTPLNAIIGFSSILMNQLFGPLGDEKYMEYSRDINYSGTHLLDIINDILDLAKAEAGKLDLNFEEIHVTKAMQKCISIIGERAAKGHIVLNVDLPKQLPPLVADRLRFIQIILNILSNAVKFTEEGGRVNVSVSTRDQGGDPSHFIITISDNGIGMKQDDIEKAFQSFGQVDSGLNRKYEGTGLGLPLTKKLLELHHGDIDIQSEVGIGTTVVITLPAVPPMSLGELAEVS